MRFYTFLPKRLKPFYMLELHKYRDECSNGNLDRAWNHLERAHVLGQRYPIAHSNVHWKMLKFGIRSKSGREIMGQIPRLVFGGVKSFVGNVPVGNRGGANVAPLKPFSIEKQLQDIFVKAGVPYFG